MNSRSSPLRPQGGPDHGPVRLGGGRLLVRGRPGRAWDRRRRRPTSHVGSPGRGRAPLRPGRRRSRGTPPPRRRRSPTGRPARLGVAVVGVHRDQPRFERAEQRLQVLRAVVQVLRPPWPAGPGPGASSPEAKPSARRSSSAHATRRPPEQRPGRRPGSRPRPPRRRRSSSWTRGDGTGTGRGLGSSDPAPPASPDVVDGDRSRLSTQAQAEKGCEAAEPVYQPGEALPEEARRERQRPRTPWR